MTTIVKPVIIDILKLGDTVVGGNVVIDEIAANRLDLSKVDRKTIVETLSAGLHSINNKFFDFQGVPLWSNSLLESRNFLSGSTAHLFDATISDDDFLRYKRIVGDIDVQVDSSMTKKIERFLAFLPKGSELQPLIYIGFKKSGSQMITLWTIPGLDLNVQIDLELVPFLNGEPTEWSKFSHSCSWDDIKLGIKGVFHKYCMRAFQARDVRGVIIVPNTPRGKNKLVHASNLAFSLKGLRVKLEPVLDVDGKQQTQEGIPLYRKISTKDSIFITDLSILFASFFGINAEGSPQEIEKMWSFIGLLDLAKKYIDKEGLKKIADGFAKLLWDKGAQNLVRGNSIGDFTSKKVAFETMTKTFGVGSMQEHETMIASYYSDLIKSFWSK